MNRVAGEFPRIAGMNARRELLVNQGKSGRFVSMMPRRVVVYSRQGCHLCDQAMQLLQEAGLKPEEVDIDQDPELVERFTTCVPVVEIDGRIRFRGRVNAVLLHRLLQADADRLSE
jgi:glutaredoxin